MLSSILPEALELWGGVECTVNRLGDDYGDQLRLTGHHEREGDLDLLKELGLAAIRYPVLWERIAPDAPDQFDWRWSDQRLGRLKELDIRPIVGLVHHGSGPRYTSLVDNSFAEGLGKFAGAVARRYPWIEEWTPVNEPLTTARFSALYGHWYPHVQDERLFWTALINQIDAIRQSMQAIRKVNPKARLVQTEDLGRTYATAALVEQARFENIRRWATWDLLTGKVEPGHPLWQEIGRFGLKSRLHEIAANPCPPDIIGINHYLTSDRFLDHRRQLYPAHCHGGNKQRPYADTEAVRVLDPPVQSWKRAITEAWERYRLPIASTEVHNDCTREEQLRWFGEAWSAAEGARSDGIQVRAVTAWALFGSSGWNTLLTEKGAHQRGAYDVSTGTPRPTAFARMLAALPETQHTLMESPGWWYRDLRLHQPAARLPASMSLLRLPTTDHTTPPILITGATGTLGRAMARACEHRGLPYRLTSRPDLDVLDDRSISAALDLYQPQAVINCSGWVRVDDAEDDGDSCKAINALGALSLSKACAERKIGTINFSSDLVFNGRKRSAYVEGDRTGPFNIYGASKTEMEEAIRGLPGDHLVIRTAAFFSPFDEANFAVAVVRALSANERFAAPEDYVITPTYVPDLCHAVLDLVIDGEMGIWHLSNGEAVSWADFAVRLAEGRGYDPRLIDAVPGSQMGWKARRPKSCPLSSERGNLLPPLQSAIDRFCSEMV